MTTKSTKNSGSVGKAVVRPVLPSKVFLNINPCISDLFDSAIKLDESGQVLDRPEFGHYNGEIPNG